MSLSENKTKPPPKLKKTQPIKKVLMERKTQYTFLPAVLKWTFATLSKRTICIYMPAERARAHG